MTNPDYRKTAPIYQVGSVLKTAAKGMLAKSDQQLAKEWARSLGYPLPNKPMNGCLAGIFVMIGMLAGLIPGFIMIYFLNKGKKKYEAELRAMTIKWIDAGKPEPGQKFRNSEPSENAS